MRHCHVPGCRPRPPCATSFSCVDGGGKYVLQWTKKYSRENVFIVPNSWMPIFASQEIVGALHDVERLLLEALGVLRSGMLVFWTKKRYVVFFCQFICNHCVCRNLTAHEYTVRCQICCLSRASGVIVIVSGPSMVSVVFRKVRSWLFCNSAFWLRLFVTRFWLADVG